MTDPQTHIIRKQVLELAGVTASERGFWEAQVRKQFYAHMLPMLEQQLSALVAPDQRLRIDYLEISLAPFPRVKDEAAIINWIVQHFEASLRQALSAIPKQETNPRIAEQIEYFLRQGHFPWWAKPQKESDLSFMMFKLQQQDPRGFKDIVTHILLEQESRLRMIRHLKDETLKMMIEAVGSELSLIFQKFADSLSRSELWPRLRIGIWDGLFQLSQEPEFTRSPHQLEVFLREHRDYGKLWASQREKTMTRFPDLFKDETTSQQLQGLLKAIKSLEPLSPKLLGRWIALESFLLSNKSELGDAQRAQLFQQGYHPLRSCIISMQLVKRLPQVQRKAMLQEIRRLLDILVDQQRTTLWQEIWLQTPLSAKPELGTWESPLLHAIVLGRSTTKAIEELAQREPMPFLKGLQHQVNERLRSLQRQTAGRSRDAEDTLYVENAGLALFAPYLKRFFEGLALVKEQAFVGEEAQQLAVHALAYLAVGKEELLQEYMLSFNKLLCGLEPDQGIWTELRLSGEVLAEISILLQAVLAHGAPAWGQLGAASLRTLFIQRAALLKDMGTHWVLKVERKEPDILLSKLPWGFQVIKLPWMERPVYIEW